MKPQDYRAFVEQLSDLTVAQREGLLSALKSEGSAGAGDLDDRDTVCGAAVLWPLWVGTVRRLGYGIRPQTL